MILQAYLNAVNLSASTYFVPDLMSMQYINYGAAVSEASFLIILDEMISDEPYEEKTDTFQCECINTKTIRKYKVMGIYAYIRILLKQVFHFIFCHI